MYRCLPLLVDSGVIRKIDVGQDNKFYALNGSSETFKAQVICSDCEKIFDIDAPFMEWYGKNVSEKLGLDVKDQRLQYMPNAPNLRKNLFQNLCLILPMVETESIPPTLQVFSLQGKQSTECPTGGNT